MGIKYWVIPRVEGEEASLWEDRGPGVEDIFINVTKNTSPFSSVSRIVLPSVTVKMIF